MPPGRCLLIVNPAARHGVSAKLLPAIREIAEGLLDFEEHVTSSPEEARAVAREAAGFETLVAVGGDGTVHEVLNGLMDRPAEDRPALGLLPTGSGNDYRRTLGVSNDLSTAVRQLASGERRHLDVGVLRLDGEPPCGRYFANSVGIGLDARVAAKAVELKLTRGWSGLTLYFRALMFVLLRQFYGHRVRLTFDDGPAEARSMLLLALSHGPTYGGGFFINPDAVPDDGLLDVCLIDAVSLPQALWRLPFVVAGRHRWMRPMHMSRHRRVGLVSDVPVEGQVDGEVVLSVAYDIEVLPGAVEAIVPRR
ncbi:MAG: diacylglycerol kinase family lipid kinase [Coriobacteriia bacterium]|nr:diacylglycerol kinase family lipid kinase [Coriobacteriia bacterium]